MNDRDFSKLKRELQPMPDDVRETLERQQLMASYRSRPAYQQNDYPGWINRANKQQTRQKRLQQMLDELQSGDRYMNMAYRGS